MEGEQVEEKEIEDESGSSIRDLLTAGFEQAETEKVLEETAVGTESETPAQAAQRARDEKGRFAKAETAEDAPSAAEPQANLETGAAVEQQTAQVAPSIASLPYLTSDERAVLSKVDPAAQSIVARRMDEAHRKLSDYGRKIASYRELDEALSPRKQHLALNGISEGRYLKQVITAADMLDADPVNGIKYFLRHYQIDPSQLVEAQQSDEPEHPLAREVAQLREYVHGQEQQRLQGQQQALATTINGFRSAKDAQGKPLRPHLEAVQAEFIPLVQALRQSRPDMTHEQVLQEAYDRAVYANPVVRQQLTQAQSAEEIAKQRKIAEAAKARGSSIVGTSGAGVTPARDDSIRGLLLAASAGQLN